MILAVYNQNTGFIVRSIEIPSFMLDTVLINSGQALIEIPRFAKNKTEYIKNGVLTELPPINNPELPFDDVSVWDSELNQWVDSPELLAYQHVEHQAQMWERIKQLRLDKMTSGVYVESIDKHLHSDEVSSIQYAQIGTAISLGMFAPMNWKAMDGDFIELTETIFRELQVAMIVNTQTIYAKAEYHKYMMMQADNPLSYNYNEGW